MGWRGVGLLGVMSVFVSERRTYILLAIMNLSFQFHHCCHYGYSFWSLLFWTIVLTVVTPVIASNIMFGSVVATPCTTAAVFGRLAGLLRVSNVAP